MLPEPWLWKPRDVNDFRLPELELKNGHRPLGQPDGPDRRSSNNGKSGLEGFMSMPTVLVPHEDFRWLRIRDGEQGRPPWIGMRTVRQAPPTYRNRQTGVREFPFSVTG